MKKMMRILCLSAVVALAFVSCKKTDSKTVVFTGITQEFVSEDDGEKAYIDATMFSAFEAGDRVKLFNISDDPSESEMATYVANEGGRQVKFHLDDAVMSVENKGAFFGFFPAENVSSATLTTNNKAVFKLNEVQHYREVNGTPNVSREDLYMAAKVDDVDYIGDANFQFQNIMGCFTLKYYDTEGWTIRSIRVEDKYFGLTGDVQLTIPNIDTEGLIELCEAYDPTDPEASAQDIADFKEAFGYSVTNVGYDVTLDFGDEGFELSNDPSNPNRFFFVLRPLALAHGYRVIVTDMDGDEYTVVDSNSNRKIRPNYIRNIAAKDLAGFHGPSK